MKLIYLLFASAICISASCSLNKNKAKPPFTPMLSYKPAKISENTKHPGYSIYMKTCYQCHYQADPSSISKEKWMLTVPAMAKHAGITEKEGKLALSYILYVNSQEVR